VLSPAYDINPVPNGLRMLSTRIDFDEATASIDLLRSVAEFFVPIKSADQIIRECADVVRQWRGFAQARMAPKLETNLMEPAFEHGELDIAR
jgi:serine/threonine-protein kinase HipA